MRIQEMKSGRAHLKKKMPRERQHNYFEFRDLHGPAFDYEDAPVVASVECDLDDPRWSVVSFEGRQAGGLKYSQASELLNELDAVGIAGLCIITDDAAARISV
jgi:hypothetical protein